MAHGYLPYNTGWYRRHFFLSAEQADRSVWLTFDGVQRASVAYLNGKFIGSHLSGYTSFRYAIESAAHFGADNVLAVFVDATAPDGWWYDGGGIYRHVWLESAAKVHIAPWGVYLPAQLTSAPDAAGQRAAALVHANVTVRNAGSSVAAFQVQVTIRDQAGHEAGKKAVLDVPRLGAGDSVTLTMPPIALDVASLWSVERPYLYQATTAVGTTTNGRWREIDSTVESFGVRSIKHAAPDSNPTADSNCVLRLSPARWPYYVI